MENLHAIISTYLEYVQAYKRLDEKTLKAYRIDLKQFSIYSSGYTDIHITKVIENYISGLHGQYKPKTVRRKIASLKAFFRYMEYKDIAEFNPFNKIQVKFREPAVLPKTIPLHLIEALLSVLYKQKSQPQTNYEHNCITRDIAVIELLFATGMRI